MSAQTFRYTELAARARTNAMNDVRDHADSQHSKYQAQLADVQAESYQEGIDDMALGRKATAISKLLNQAITFKKLTDNDLQLLTFLQNDTLEFLESGELIAGSAALPEQQVLDFDQYKGDYFNSYTAETEDFTYKVIKMHSDRTFTAMRVAKNETDAHRNSDEEVSSVGQAMRVLQAHHTNYLKAKNMPAAA